MKNLLVEYNVIEYGKDLLAEAADVTKPLMLKNVLLQRAETKNQNGRIYPKEVLMREAKKYSESFVSERRALGELDHPDSSVVNLGNVSHNVLEMAWKGDDLVGTVEVLSTPSGNILKELFKSGVRLGISSRGMGSVKEVMREGGNTMEVQPDFELIAFDFVSNPSTHGAFLSPVNESANAQIKNTYGSVDRIITDIIREF